MIAIIGGKGSIGSRYAQICKYYAIDHEVIDIDSKSDLFSFEKYIICTPTHTHVGFLHALQGKKVLCEKPVDYDPRNIPDYPNMWTVCNYKYVTDAFPKPYFIEYDYYKTGPDGLYFDLAQILYLDPQAKINNQSPKWNMKVNGKVIPYREVEKSYIRMIHDFSEGHYQNLWTLAQGRDMSQAVLHRIEQDHE